MLTVEAWRDDPRLTHGFLERPDVPPGCDWEAALGAMDIDAPVVVPKQVHGAHVTRVASPGAPGEADALVTTRPGLLVGVVTADCTPVLLRARGAGAVAAVHAGWRGAASGVVEAGVAALATAARAPSRSIEAAIGPAIGPCCYQVGAEVRDAFRARTGEVTATAWQPDGERFRLDLRVAVRCLLDAAGVASVATVGPCTRCSPAFHSYRRDGATAGRQLSFIGRL